MKKKQTTKKQPSKAKPKKKVESKIVRLIPPKPLMMEEELPKPMPILTPIRIQKYQLYENADQPSRLKTLEIEDMKRFGYKITRAFLLKNGFRNTEINWLINEGLIVDDKEDLE